MDTFRSERFPLESWTARSDISRSAAEDRAIIRRVPKRHRAEVRAMQAATVEVWTATITASEQHAYNEGVRAATPDKSAEDAGFERRWKSGYESAFN